MRVGSMRVDSLFVHRADATQHGAAHIPISAYTHTYIQYCSPKQHHKQTMSILYRFVYSWWKKDDEKKPKKLTADGKRLHTVGNRSTLCCAVWLEYLYERRMCEVRQFTLFIYLLMFTSLVLATGLYTHLVLRVFFYYGWSHYCLIIASTFYTYEVMKYDSIKYPTHCLN